MRKSNVWRGTAISTAFMLLYPLTASADLSDFLNKASQALGAVGQGLDAINTMRSTANKSSGSSSSPQASPSGNQASGYQTINGTRVFTQVDIANHQATFSNECGSQTLTQAQLQGGAIPDDIVPCPRPAQANQALPKNPNCGSDITGLGGGTPSRGSDCPPSNATKPSGADTASWQHHCEELEQAQSDLAISCWSGLAGSAAARNDPALIAMAKAHADRLAAMQLAKPAPGCPYGDLASGLGGALCATDTLTQAQCESSAVGGMWTPPFPGRPSTGKCSYVPREAKQESPREQLTRLQHELAGLPQDGADTTPIKQPPAEGTQSSTPNGPQSDSARPLSVKDLPAVAELAGMEPPGSDSRERIVGSIKTRLPRSSGCIDDYVARLDDLRWNKWQEPFAQSEARIEREQQEAKARRESSQRALATDEKDVCKLLADRDGVQPATVRWVVASNGTIPSSALIGGHEASGQGLAVCRGRYNGGMHPGKVVGSSCSIGWGGHEIMLSDFEVAVGSVSWVAASNGYVPPGALIAGGEPGRQLPLCRVAYNGGVHPGKFVVDKCNFSWGGVEVTSPVYEVGIGTSLDPIGLNAH